MNIIIFSDAQIPSKRAESVFIMKMAEAFAQREEVVRVVLFCLEGKKSVTESADIYSFYGVKSNFQIVPFRYKYKGIGRLYLMASRYSSVYHKEYSSFRPYVRFMLPLLFIRRQRSPIIELHNDIWNVNFLFKKAINRFSDTAQFIFLTEAVKADFPIALPENRAQVIHDAASKVVVSADRAQLFEKKLINVVYVGSLMQGKGLEVITKLIELMYLPYFFHIVGGSEQEIKDWEEKISTTKSNFKFYGFVNHAQVPSFLTQADICLLPNQKVVKSGKGSDIGRYTSPMKLFEYMSHGKAIIASDLPNIREVITQEAILVDPEDEMAWQKALYTLKPETKRKALGSKAKETFLKTYTWEKRVERILKPTTSHA